MNSLLYYYNNVQKMAAYRQAKRMQRGVKLGENQSPTAATKLVSKGLPIGVDDFSIEFYGNSYGSAGYGYPTIFSNTKPVDWQTYAKSFGENGIQTVFYNSQVNKPEVKYTAPNESTRFHFVWTRENTTLRAYINGDLTGEVVDIPVKDLGDLQLAIANSSDVGFVRVWNYALSADEIATLYNNNDPMGYVVPKAKRDVLLAEYLPQNLMGQKERPLQVISENSYTWDNVTTGAPSLDIRTNPGIKTGVTYKVNLTVSGFSEGEPYLYAGSRVSIPAANGTYDLLVTPSGDYSYISVYGGTNIQLKNLTITVNKVEVANVATSWLDSAKQLPLSDEYMEPLFESIGGYDMAANGAPEILYNE